MKYTQIFVCIIARGQIARDRAMGPYFIGNMAWRAFWGRGDFLRDQLVWVHTMEYLMSGKPFISLVSDGTLRTDFFGRYIDYGHGSSAVKINFYILVSIGEGWLRSLPTKF